MLDGERLDEHSDHIGNAMVGINKVVRAEPLNAQVFNKPAPSRAKVSENLSPKSYAYWGAWHSETFARHGARVISTLEKSATVSSRKSAYIRPISQGSRKLSGSPRRAKNTISSISTEVTVSRQILLVG